MSTTKSNVQKTIGIIPNDDIISLELEFNTLLIVTYLVRIREENSNQVVFEWTGDNSNDADDKYILGTARKNIGRTSFITFSIIDQDGKGGDFEVKAIFKHNGEVIDEGILTSGKEKLEPGENYCDVHFISRFVLRGEK